jgi:hypothetical protein
MLAYAAAYAASVADEERAAALWGLAHVLERRWAWENLGAVLDTIVARTGPVPPARVADLARMRASVALARRDLDGAIRSLGGSGAGPLLGALAGATPTDTFADLLAFADVNGDGVEEAVLARHRDPTITVARPGRGCHRSG